MGRRRNSGHGNKLYDDSSVWGAVVIMAFIFSAIAIVVLAVWTNAD